MKFFSKRFNFSGRASGSTPAWGNLRLSDLKTCTFFSCPLLSLTAANPLGLLLRYSWLQSKSYKARSEDGCF